MPDHRSSWLPPPSCRSASIDLQCHLCCAVASSFLPACGLGWLAACVTRSIHDHTYKSSTSSQLFVGHSASSRHPIYLLAFPMTGTHMPISISSEEGPPMFMHIIYISIEMWQQKAKAAYSFIRSQCFFSISPFS